MSGAIFDHFHGLMKLQKKTMLNRRCSPTWKAVDICVPIAYSSCYCFFAIPTALSSCPPWPPQRRLSFGSGSTGALPALSETRLSRSAAGSALSSLGEGTRRARLSPAAFLFFFAFFQIRLNCVSCRTGLGRSGIRLAVRA